MLASKLSLKVISSPGLTFNFTSSIFTYLSVVGTEVEGLVVGGNRGVLGFAQETVAV